jgi:N utilization substance protein B
MSVEERSAARLAIVQALYQMEVAGKGLNEIYAEFEVHWIGREIEGDQYKPAELQFFRDIVKGVLDNQTAIDRALDAALQGGWPLQRIEAVMRAILRAGAYELGFRRDVPVKVVIKEYVDVAGAFFGPTESGMINAVLDRLARQARPEHFGEK